MLDFLRGAKGEATPEGNVMAKMKLVKIGLSSAGPIDGAGRGRHWHLGRDVSLRRVSSTGVFGISGVAYAMGHLMGSCISLRY